MAKEILTPEYKKAIDYVEQMIQSGQLRVGSRLPTERMIAAELGIGRNSTREALSILHGMGMIERVQGSGNYVTGNAEQSIEQILTMQLALGMIGETDVCEFRRTMEKAVAMTLLEREYSADAQKYMEQLLIKMEQAQGRELVELDKAFHDAWITATGNRLYMTLMKAVTEIYRTWIDLVLQEAEDHEKKRLLAFHRQMAEQMARHDTEGVLAAIDGHYDLIERLLTERSRG